MTTTPDTTPSVLLDAFRQEVSTWLQAHCPPAMRTPQREDEVVWGGRNERFPHPEARLWMQRMVERGWLCPTWPTAYGGGGLSADQHKVLQQELRAIKARAPIRSYGISMLGPVLLAHGTEAQKSEHLTRMARGEIRWCQGYSEPGAGSDLAGVRTRAQDQGDHYVVNGSKIWTSHANQSDWIFCLVRTDPALPKHEGLGFLLIDLASPGVRVEPITLISGASAFCQTFFDDVRVPKHNLVGTPTQGWAIAKQLLQHERRMVSEIGGASDLGSRGRRLHELARQYVGEVQGRIADPVLRDRIAEHEMNEQAFTLTLARAGEEARRGQGHAAQASLFKLLGTEQNQRKHELMLDCMRWQGLGWSGPGFDERELKVTRQWLRSRANTIEGGTSEIQLDVIARRLLELPQ